MNTAPQRSSVFVLTLLAAASMMMTAAAPAARAEAPSFVAEVDRNQVGPGELLTYEVTLNVADDQVDDYRPPEFKGFKVVDGSQAPNRQMHMQMGGGGTFIQNSLSWRYQLTPAAGMKGVVAIGAAKVKVNGHEMRSNIINVRLGGGPPPSPAAPAAGSSAPAAPPPAAAGEAPPMSSAPGGNFIRVVADKPRVFVGEQVTVGWYLYLTQRPDKYETITEPRTDAFWTEELTSVNGRNRLTLNQEMAGGRVYQVASLFKKALFPLQPGRLTISPLEAEIAQVDFFGSSMRSQRLKAEPTVIEAMPLPKQGQPAGFEPGSVGKFTLEARADRDTVSVGEAVTLTVEIKGQGNVRNLRPPKLPALDGWKGYEPKVTVNIDPGEPISGSKIVEYLLLPERAGTTIIPSFELAYFNPETQSYAVAKSAPLRVVVTPDATGSDRVAGGPATPGPPAAAGSAVENVISAEIRPIRARPALNRDLGVTFYRSRFFFGILLIPPVGLALGSLGARLRERLGQDTQRNRRRRVRQMVRERLGAAEAHRAAGRTSAFYIEIDRVVRDVLTARLRRPVTGLRMDELRGLLLQRGMPAEEAGRVIGELEACDLARFAPGSDGAGSNERERERMSSALERAGELIVAIEKAPLREEAPA